ncbi:hypothetical protein DPSP01_008466 [Paraphaeosphaeria sporulosa]
MVLNTWTRLDRPHRYFVDAQSAQSYKVTITTTRAHCQHPVRASASRHLFDTHLISASSPSTYANPNSDPKTLTKPPDNPATQEFRNPNPLNAKPQPKEHLPIKALASFFTSLPTS